MEKVDISLLPAEMSSIEKSMKSLRPLYEKFGVENYYKHHSKDYCNPHQQSLEELIRISVRNQKINYSNVLDLCCGHGEASIALLKMLPNIEIEGLDKYTATFYERKTNKKCYSLGFKDILQRDCGLKNNYTAIICSFGLHLCPRDKLFSLTSILFTHTRTLVIITPHKRPRLEDLSNLCTLDFVIETLTPKGKKVYLKCYQKSRSL